MRRNRTARKRRTAFSMLEIVISTMIVSVSTIAVMKAVGATVNSRYELGIGNQGHQVATALLLEILGQPYEDPLALGTFGPETGEDAVSTRVLFDDVDDYSDWTASPPVDKDGTTLPNTAGWTRSVSVAYVDPDDLTATVSDDQGVKRIIVVVEEDGKTLAKVTAITTSAWQSPPYE